MLIERYGKDQMINLTKLKPSLTLTTSQHCISSFTSVLSCTTKSSRMEKILLLLLPIIIVAVSFSLSPGESHELKSEGAGVSRRESREEEDGRKKAKHIEGIIENNKRWDFHARHKIVAVFFIGPFTDFLISDVLQENYQNGLIEIVQLFGNINGTLNAIKGQMSKLIQQSIKEKTPAHGIWESRFNPKRTLKGGYENPYDIYIARLKRTRNEILPVKFIVTENVFRRIERAFTVNGSIEVEVELSKIEFLSVQPSYEWVWQSDGDIPHGAIIGGKTKKNENIYVCRIYLNDGIIVPGGLVQSRRQCITPHFGVRTAWDYEILRDSTFV